jgi:hypothetical protein
MWLNVETIGRLLWMVGISLIAEIVFFFLKKSTLKLGSHLVEWELTGKIEVLSKILPQSHFVNHKYPHEMTWDCI